VIPPDAYRPAPGWYRQGDVLRWHTGFQWTQDTRPLPGDPSGDPLSRKRFTVRRLAVLALVIVLVLAITAAAYVSA